MIPKGDLEINRLCQQQDSEEKMFIVVYGMGNVCCDSVISKLTQLPSAAI